MIKKILITVPTLEAGGMERAALNFAISLSKIGYEVKIFTVSNNIIWFDIPIDIEVMSGKDNTRDLWMIPVSLFRLRNTSKKFRPDVVLSFSGRLSAYICIALSGLRIPVLPFDRNNPMNSYGKFNDFLNSKVFPKCKAIVVQTNKAKRIFQKRFGNKNIIVLKNPIRKLNIDNNQRDNIIITVSRLVDGKGIEKLIKIFASTTPHDWSLYILGDGSKRESLEELVVKLNLQDQIKFLGFKKNVDRYLSKASIFAFASESEGYPNALLEAMCAGLACISFDCPAGPSDMILDGENGFLVELNNIGSYKEKLKRLMEDESLRNKFSNEALKLKSKHNPDLILKNFISQVESLLSD